VGAFRAAGVITLALDAGSATARVSLSACPPYLRMALVGPNGEVAELVRCAGPTPTLDLAVPTSGAVHLVVDATANEPPRPQTLGLPESDFAIEGVRFE
jgi:hypothetical protein